MALFPKIQSPCPFVGQLSSIMDGDVCRVCERQVFDITDMSDHERIAFMKGCKGEVCVSYRIPALWAVAALAVAAAAAPVAAAACEDVTTVVITGGGIKDPANASYVHVPDDRPVPNLPVVYETKADGVARPADRAPPSGAISPRDGS
jgi:hypothetical protein